MRTAFASLPLRLARPLLLLCLASLVVLVGSAAAAEQEQTLAEQAKRQPTQDPGKAVVQQQRERSAGDQEELDRDQDSLGPIAAPAAGALTLTPDEIAEIADGKKMIATPTGRAPIIDGIIDEDVWAHSDVVSDLLQRDPDNGQPSSQRTEIRILYDEEYIYVSFINFDTEPDKITATDLRRDSRLQADDTIAVFFDTFHDHRNGYVFRVNPLGTKYDATVKDETELNSQWDEKWEAAAQITERGWEAEMAIPWKAVRFPAGDHIWGMGFKREIRRRNEEVNWSSWRRGYDFRAVSQMGHLVGLKNLKLNGRYRLKPYVSGGYNDLNATEAPISEGNGDIGIEDFKVQITPNITADFTLKTDFAQVEDDEERVNLTRFPLFFPERREFFLESANVFRFGSASEHGGFGSPDALLFHSRRIGLVDGDPVPMNYGIKLTGKIGGSTIGVVNAGTGNLINAGNERVSGSNYSAVRWRQDILGRSYVGAMFTNVEGEGSKYNRVFGLDASFRFLEHASIGGYVAQARGNDINGGSWVGQFGAGWDSDLWSLNAGYSRVDEDFETDLGFIRRRDVIKQKVSGSWTPRPHFDWMRQISFFGSVDYITDIGGSLQTREQSVNARFSLESGDSFSVRVERKFERLEEEFDVEDEAIVPAGDYNFNEWSLSFNTFQGRRFSARTRVGGGGWFSGSRKAYSLSGTGRFTEKFNLSPSWNINIITLPDASFTTHILRVRGGYNFSDRWLTSALVQYNSLDDSMAVFARLNYIYRTGDDFFLVLKQTSLFEGVYSGQQNRAIIAKMTRSFDF